MLACSLVILISVSAPVAAAESAVKERRNGPSFSGNGSKELPPFKVPTRSSLRWTNTGAAVLITMLGGVQSFFGPAAGAVVVKFLESTLIPKTPYWPAVIGAIFAAFVLLAPGGLAGLATQARALLRRRAEATPPAPPVAPALESTG